MSSAPANEDRDGVSVVIPTRNRAALLERTLETVRAQTSDVAEIIVADDGSTDATASLLREWGLTPVRNSKGGWGAAKARNAGLARVRTRYVAFLDSDDLLLPDAIARLRSALESTPDAPFAFGRGLAASRSPEGWRPEGIIRPDSSELRALSTSIFVRNSVPSSGALVRTDAARRIGGYDSDVVFDEDHHFWVRLSRIASPVYVDELVCIHRRHGENRHTAVLAFQDAGALIRLAKNAPELAPRLPHRRGVELCEVLIGAVKARRPGILWAAARQLLMPRQARADVLARAFEHWRARRAWNREGWALWEADQGLRRWLSRY